MDKTFDVGMTVDVVNLEYVTPVDPVPQRRCLTNLQSYTYRHFLLLEDSPIVRRVHLPTWHLMWQQFGLSGQYNKMTTISFLSVL